MELSQLLSFALVAALLVMSPGPNGLLVIKTLHSSGRAACFANIAGFITTFYLHGALSIFGLSLLLMQSAQAFFIFKMLGAAYLCWIGIKALIGAWRDKPNTSAVPQNSTHKRSRTLGKAYIEGFLTNALNPKVSMFYLAAFPQFIPAQGAVEAAFTLIAVHCAINFLWFCSLIALFGKLRQRAQNFKLQRLLKTTTGLMFLGFGAKLALLKP